MVPFLVGYLQYIALKSGGNPPVGSVPAGHAPPYFRLILRLSFLALSASFCRRSSRGLAFAQSTKAEDTNSVVIAISMLFFKAEENFAVSLDIFNDTKNEMNKSFYLTIIMGKNSNDVASRNSS